MFPGFACWAVRGKYYKLFLIPGFAYRGRVVNTYKAFLIPGVPVSGLLIAAASGEDLQSVPDPGFCLSGGEYLQSVPDARFCVSGVSMKTYKWFLIPRGVSISCFAGRVW